MLLNNKTRLNFGKAIQHAYSKRKEKQNQKPFITLVDKILSTKENNPKADTSNLEKEIDELVYKLYELAEEEIEIVKGI